MQANQLELEMELAAPFGAGHGAGGFIWSCKWSWRVYYYLELRMELNAQPASRHLKRGEGTGGVYLGQTRT